jgi:hypothetical protein
MTSNAEQERRDEFERWFREAAAKDRFQTRIPMSFIRTAKPREGRPRDTSRRAALPRFEGSCRSAAPSLDGWR